MEADIPGPASPADPTLDQPGKTAPMPQHIVFLLQGARILLGYGQHLLATIRHRAAAPTFPTIASCFGTANLATIIAHLNRGILRAAALERFLLARAATGRDVEMVIRRNRTDEEPPPAPADAQPEPPAKPKAARRPPLPPGSDNPEFFTPTQEELDRQVRRRSIGRTFAEISLDLGVVPELCASAFWNGMFEVMHYFGGNGVITVMREKTRRVHAFIKEQDKKLDSAWDWLHLKRDEIRERLGFFIGEEPVDPFATAPATGPP
jgi:hypothetical protein